MLDEILQAFAEAFGLAQRVEDSTQDDYALAGPAEEAGE